MDSAGVVGWATQFGTTADDTLSAIALDNSANIYVAGNTGGTFAGQTKFGGTTDGNTDGYVVKMDSAGVIGWAKHLGTSESEGVNAIALDNSANIYAVGYTVGTFAGQTNIGGMDGFVIKMNSAGVVDWTNQFGTADTDFPTAVALDNSANIYVAGYTLGSFPGQTPFGKDDGFVMKMNSAGAVIWTRQFGTTEFDYTTLIAFDSSANIYVAGYTYGTFAGQTKIGGFTDSYVVKMDSAGVVSWTNQFGSNGNDYANAISLDTSANIYVAGSTDGTFEGQTSSGGYDGFVGTLAPYSPSPDPEYHRTTKESESNLSLALGLGLGFGLLIVAILVFCICKNRNSKPQIVPNDGDGKAKYKEIESTKGGKPEANTNP